ncbi:MAG: molybdopterin molybdotransferase MoeA [Chitinophagaceae bacterium]|nr:molybdopterin molybdotransferase MoeA [Chitinophagaceae bacterium]
MISVAQALEMVIQQAHSHGVQTRRLSDALNYTLAQTLYASMPWPTYPQAAMDGYGLKREYWNKQTPFRVKQVIAAGDFVEHIDLQPGEAVRIFTGAFVPEGIDTIVQQEHIRTENNALYWPDVCPPLAQHIRPTASQTKVGEVIASPGDIVTPARAAFLSGLGIHEVPVFQHPRVAIVCTGSELVSPGNSLPPGKIYESNSMALQMALAQRGIAVAEIVLCSDEANLIEQTLRRVTETYDIVLITGGVSVGNYDIVVPTLNRLGVETLFHKVKQKPGKPFYFGKKNKSVVFGLPGNPASVLTCFYMYTLPYLDACEQRATQGLPQFTLPIQQAYPKKAGLTHFVRARVNNGACIILPNQESYKMNSFAEANAIARFDETMENPSEGTLVPVYCF